MPGGEPGGKPPLVLVVDDQEFMRRVARGWLEDQGFAVEEASNGAEALEAFGRCGPDLVLLDVVMPVMDGFTACAELRRLPRGAHVPVLIMTALGDTDSIRRAYDAGATDFIHKPINGLVLGYRIRYMLRSARTAEALRRSEAKLLRAQRIAALGHWELEAPSRSFVGSDELYRIVGRPRQTLGETWSAFLECVHPEDREAIGDLMDQILADPQPRSADFRIVSPGGAERIVHQEAEIVQPADGGGLRVEGTLQDVTDLRRAEERIRFLASYDPLTGLPNRTWILDRLGLLLPRWKDTERGLALLLVGVDHFKRINDTLGHRHGDRLLQEVAERLVQGLFPAGNGRPAADSGSFVGRFVGDEFAAFLAEPMRVQEVARTAARLARALRQPYRVNDQEVFLTVSIGVSMYPFDGRDAESLLRNAASAMAHAKAQGVADYQFYAESMNTAALDHFQLESALRRAVERGEFTLHYQPQVDLRSGRIVGAEALIRWESPERGMVFPLEFIPLAEETGLILPIGDWVFRAACTQAKEWQEAGLPAMRMAVNVSARQFAQRDFVGGVVRALEEAGLDPGCLDSELTESTVMQDVDSAIRSLRELKSMGLQVSIDDFGTGYSSLSYLRRFPLDALKIDYSFMADLPHHQEHAAIIAAIIALGRTLNLRVVAEGVESKEQLDFLRRRGCDEAQGNFLCPAVPAEAFERVLRETWNPAEWRGADA